MTTSTNVPNTPADWICDCKDNEGLEQERDRLHILAGELIAVIRVNVMRGSFTDVATEDLDAFLAPFVERLTPNPNQPQS
jgi:hypothetical protein